MNVSPCDGRCKKFCVGDCFKGLELGLGVIRSISLGGIETAGEIGGPGKRADVSPTVTSEGEEWRGSTSVGILYTMELGRAGFFGTTLYHNQESMWNKSISHWFRRQRSNGFVDIVNSSPLDPPYLLEHSLSYLFNEPSSPGGRIVNHLGPNLAGRSVRVATRAYLTLTT